HRIARPPVGRFLTHPPRPYLPPFPTRRSSDLPDELGKGPPVETRTSALHPGSTIRSARGSTNCPAAPSESASASAATSRRKPAPREGIGRKGKAFTVPNGSGGGHELEDSLAPRFRNVHRPVRTHRDVVHGAEYGVPLIRETDACDGIPGRHRARSRR